MEADKRIAVVGLGAILPDAPDVAAFWANIEAGRYSISDVPPSRWDPELYYDPDPSAPDKTYSKIGGWVRTFEWDPLAWKLPIPPTVSEAMDGGQKWAIACTRAALADYGYPERPLDQERTAVIIGNALAGELHYYTALRVYFPEFAEQLSKAPSFVALPEDVRSEILSEFLAGARGRFPRITEDTMPGELGNVLAGRVAALFNLRGPNYTTDAACGSALAAMSAAVRGLADHEYDAVITGGIDRNMGAVGFVKFSKIGALSATGTRPYADGADGFVMGEGAGLFLLKRLEDAERDGDRIYAVIRSLAGSSDGKGKGITAPNPVGQRLVLDRAWKAAGESPASAGLIEGHGTSTRVGDVVEVGALTEVLQAAGASAGTIALGSVKSNIGHLKAAAGAAGMLKTILALHHKVLPPSLNFDRPNPDIDFAHSPLSVNTELRPWEIPGGGVRRAGVSAFGFGGTNWHAVLEEYVPGPGSRGRKIAAGAAARPPASMEAAQAPVHGNGGRPSSAKPPLRGVAVLGASSSSDLASRLESVKREADEGSVPGPARPSPEDLAAPERIAIDYGDGQELAARAGRALQALASDDPIIWKALRGQGIFRGHGRPGKVAFLYTGQGSQYANMLRDLAGVEPIVQEVFDRADRVMSPLLGRPLTDYLFVDGDDPAVVAAAEAHLMQTEITQPAVLAVDLALTNLLAEYGIEPDMVMGHSLGEYGALVAAGALSFDHALEAVSARGREMASITVADNGRMAAVFAPMEEIDRIVSSIQGYVVVANINSSTQAVIGGASDAVDRAVESFLQAGHRAVMLPVSHAFHTSIVAPASEPLRRTLVRLDLQPPKLPVVANVSGEFYPTGEGARDEILDILAAQVASPVQFLKGLHTLHEAGARVFVEVGPKRALQGFVDDVLADDPDTVSLFTNHPKVGDLPSFNQALCGLYAEGLGAPAEGRTVEITNPPTSPLPEPKASPVAPTGNGRDALGGLFTEFLDRARELYARNDRPGTPTPPARPVVITGAALGLPGTERIFDDLNVARILRGDQLIDTIPVGIRQAMLDKHVTRLVKRENGDPSFEAITDPDEVIKLAGRGGALDLEQEFGVAAERIPALDRATVLAVGAGIDALRDAGMPLVARYRTTSKGTKLPDGWALPERVRDETGVIFASAFPGYDAFADEMTRYHQDRARRERLHDLESLRARFADEGAGPTVVAEIERRIAELQGEIDRDPYLFDRRFLFKALPMGHAQFAEIVGARGPNTQINSACASTTQAIALAEDWIREGRCRRVVVIAGDDATSDHLLEWIGAGFLASGAAATDDVVEEAATPFDRRRHGLLIGMGAASLVVESAEAAAERGLRPICEVLSATTANSAYHGSRLDVSHIAGVMETLVSDAERRWGIHREEIAPETLFVSHETYTPARGGSAAAEVEALRSVFGTDADRIVVANTKGFTGHPMGVGIEDVVAVKSLETGVVPPVPNYREVDPDLGTLRLSKGGAYPIRYALRLAAGFGSQISMTLLRWVPSPDGSRKPADHLGYEYRIADRAAWERWLADVSGADAPQVEVVQRRLRVRESGAEPHATVPRPVAETQASAQATRQREAEPMVPLLPFVQPDTAPIAEPQPTAAVGPDSVADAVLALVAEKTGYPPDMLDLDLDMEADLGVDTVKQAEIFATIRESYGIPRDDTLKLREFPTLQHVIGFVRERMPGGGAPPLVTEPPEADGSAVQHEIVDIEPTAAEGPAEEAEPAAAVDSSEEAVRDAVLALVAEKTGYPPDMLDLDLDMEADLGVDTVKQAEIFATIRESYGIPRDDTLKLREFPTLQHVIGFVRERRGKAQAPAATGPRSVGATETPARDRSTEGLEAADAVPGKVPVPVLRPSLDICKPTGVVIGPGTRIVVMADAGGAAKALTVELEGLGAEILLIDDRPEADALGQRVRDWLGDDTAGVYWLAALDPDPAPAALDLETWREELRTRVKLLFTTMQTLGERVSFLVSATRLGGLHGYEPAGALGVMGGAVTGFTKAFSRERPAATVKAVDFEQTAFTEDISRALIDETLADPGAVEIGRQGGLRWAIGLDDRILDERSPQMPLGPETVFVVTGAAGGIVSAIVSDLASASGGLFHLLDLAPEPDEADPDIQRFATDREGLKRDIAARLKAAGERPTPAMVERRLATLERSHAALAAIQAVRASGGTARYHQVDLTDAVAVADVIDRVRAENGRIDVLLHAAGLEISHLLPDKPAREFDLVFDVKSDGWFNLMAAARDLPVAATVAFSSIAGRFGNAGQTDYSSANDLLCKAASNIRRTRPGTRAVAIDWTAWAGIGMASRGSIPKVMEAAGIDMLPPEAGVPIVRRELVRGTVGEVVIGQSLGLLTEEPDELGGIDPALAPARAPMAGRVVRMGVYEGLEVETTLDPAKQPFLDDHRIEGVPVLPGVMGLEAFAQTATLLVPRWHVRSVEDVDFLAPVKFYRDEPRTLTISAQFRPDGEEILARCRLWSSRQLPNQAEPQMTTHFTGIVRLSRVPPPRASATVPAVTGEAVGSDTIYGIYFHGPAYQVLDRVVPGEQFVGVMANDLPPNHRPPEAPAIVAPRLIELCFQTAGMWELRTVGRFALPLHVDRVTTATVEGEAVSPFSAVVTPVGDGMSFDVSVIDSTGTVLAAVEGYRTIALPGAVDPEALALLRT